AAEVKPGTPAVVSLPGTSRRLRATVLHVEPLVDPATGAREARLQLLEAPTEAPAGLTVTVNLIVDERKAAISIPRSAVLKDGTGTRVRVVDGESIVRERAVRIVDWPAEAVIVEAGLSAGDLLLVAPGSARPGQRVEIAR